MRDADGLAKEDARDDNAPKFLPAAAFAGLGAGLDAGSCILPGDLAPSAGIPPPSGGANLLAPSGDAALMSTSAGLATAGTD